MIMGFLFASACGPLEQMLRSTLRTEKKALSYLALSGIVVALAVLVVVFSVQMYSLIYQAFDSSSSLISLTDKVDSVRAAAWGWLESFDLFNSAEWRDHIDKIINSVIQSSQNGLLEVARGFITSTPQIVLSLFIFALAFMAFLMMGSKVFISTADALGFKGDHSELFNRFERICFLSLGSVILTGAVQASIMTLGARIAGEGSYFLIFVATFLFSMIPLLGAGFVGVVFTVVAIVQGQTDIAIIMGITTIITGGIENILKAWLFSKASKTNPIISIISLLGGIALFGFVGLFLAPTIEQLVMSEFRRRNSAVPLDT